MRPCPDRCRPPKSSSLTPAPPSSRRALATSTPPQGQPISPCPGVPALSRRGVGDRRRSGTAKSETEASSTSAAERDDVHTSTGHSGKLAHLLPLYFINTIFGMSRPNLPRALRPCTDRRRHPRKSSSPMPAPPSSRRGLVTSTPPQEQRISRYREREPSLSALR